MEPELVLIEGARGSGKTTLMIREVIAMCESTPNTKATFLVPGDFSKSQYLREMIRKSLHRITDLGNEFMFDNHSRILIASDPFINNSRIPK